MENESSFSIFYTFIGLLPIFLILHLTINMPLLNFTKFYCGDFFHIIQKAFCSKAGKIIIILLASFQFTNAQITSYTFTPVSGTFTTIKGVAGSSNPTLNDLDEGFNTNITLPFNFNYNSVPYNRIGASTNGFLYFGASFPGTAGSNAGWQNDLKGITSISSARPFIAPLWDDMKLPSASDFTILTTGTTPARVFTIEWSNVRWPYDASAASMSFQVKLYETTNVIEFNYSSLAGNPGFTDGASIGITATTTGNGNFVSLNNSSSSPLTSSTTETTNITTKPATGQIYRFTPPNFTPVITSFTPTSANFGTTVTISGTNLNATAVSFGGVPASSYIQVSPNTITANVSNGATGNVSVTTTNGTASLGGFIYLGPAISSFTPSSAGFNGQITITGTGFTGTTTVSIGGIMVASFNVINDNTIIAVVTNGSSGNVSVTSPGGTAIKSGFIFSGPKITSISPESGAVGTTVTITGNGFKSDLTGNIVLFGGVKAIVTSASTNSLTVISPPGANYQPVTVTTGNYVGYAPKPFIVTTACSANDIAASFSTRTDFSFLTNMTAISTTDLDGDGKLDFIGVTNQNVSYFRNRGFNGVIIFDPARSIGNNNSNPAISLTLGDLNGDGKPDVITTNSLGNITICINTSEPGNITFAEPLDITTGDYTPSGVVIGDLDGNGLADIAVTLKGSNMVSVFPQIYNPLHGKYILKGNFVHPTPSLNGNFTVNDGSIELRTIDKIQLAMYWNGNTAHPISDAGTLTYIGAQQPIYKIVGTAVDSVKNSFTGGTNVVYSLLNTYPNRYDISTKTIFAQYGYTGNTRIYTDTLIYTAPLDRVYFEPKKDFTTGTSPSGISISDIDGDNKPDLVVTNSGSNTVSILKNTSTTGVISFAAKQDYPAGSQLKAIVTGDLDGDGKNDIAVSNTTAGTLSILKNTSTPGTISITAPVAFSTGQYPNNIDIGDINGDGKPDLCTVNKLANTISILRNSSTIGTIVFEPKTDIVTGNTPLTITLGDLNADGKMDILAADSLDAILGIWRNRMNEPVVTSFTPQSGNNGTTVNVAGKYFTNATGVSFGSTPAVSFTVLSDTTITAIVSTGASGSVSVSSLCGTSSATGFLFSGMHTISSFSPESGPVGTTVLITGTHFSTTFNDNIVYFGSVKANVTAATDTTLTLTVPLAASFLPISITINNLTAFAPKPFIVTFSCGSPLTVSSFGIAKTFQIPNFGTWNIATGDLDNDGKPDVVSASYPDNTISIFRNTGTPGNISLGTRQDIYSGKRTDDVLETDLDGDGKLDIVVYNDDESINDLSVFRNTSTPGNISFAPLSFFNSGLNGDKITTGDFDGDGRIDLLVTLAFQGISILRNISITGNISFEPGITFSSPIHSIIGATSDLDGDGKTDIAFTNFDNTISVLRNTTINGMISFAPKVDYAYGFTGFELSIADMDGDGKPDMLVTHTTSQADSNISIYLNTSTVGNISFAPKINYFTGLRPFKLAISDMDGDGKPDIIATGGSGMTVIKNTSISGTLSFAPKQTYSATYSGQNLAIADMDGDGKADIVGGGGNPYNVLTNSISILRNQLCTLVPLCPGASNTLISSINGSTYQWQVNTGGGYVNIIDDANYTGSQTNVLQLNNIPSSWTGYKYRCIADAVNSNEITIRFVSTWTGTVSSAWENPLNWECGIIPDTFTDVYLKSGPVILNSSTSIRTFTVLPNINFTVNSGNILTILQ